MFHFDGWSKPEHPGPPPHPGGLLENNGCSARPNENSLKRNTEGTVEHPSLESTPEILSRPATEGNERKKSDVYDEIIAPACVYARTLNFFSCSKPSELILRILPNLRRGDL
ncbi:unnamed protein product [Bursaphelenchus xylophilus]|uniref:(pine wood nematode) hypothetical protein n=1 Tax=Bursaphelenchus xylophilus TaxID=6326 RepID=A0A7I8XQW9_BURXY|nr:unnamed protein product [Bursaphelenchus xylophilus]CAG9088067.1 unnamed protein product [Bursaphelenchus xylophilus]